MICNPMYAKWTHIRGDSTRSASACGYTLVEMAIALAITGAILSVVIAMMAAVTSPSGTGSTGAATSQASSASSLASAQQALLGYSLARFQFPLPAGSPALTLPGFSSGTLPADLLGLPEAPAVSYAVDSRLIGISTYNPDPDGISQGSLPGRTAPGLPDLCYSLAVVQRQPRAYAGGVPVALVLAVTGAFSPTSLPAALPLPDSPAGLQLAAQGVYLAEFGAGELASALNCPRYLGRVAAAAKSVAAAVDMNTWAQSLVDFRKLQLAEAAQAWLSLALKVALTAATELAMANDEASGLIQIAITQPDIREPANAVSYGLLLVLPGYMAALSVQLAEASQSLNDIPDGVNAANAAFAQAQAYQAWTAQAVSDSQIAYTYALSGL